MAWQNPTSPIARDEQEAGFSIVEVMVATGLLASALVALAQLFAIATTTNAAARSSTLTMMLAEQKIEQLRALQYTYDRAGLPVQDTLTDLACHPPAELEARGFRRTRKTRCRRTPTATSTISIPGADNLAEETVIPDGTAFIPPMVGRAAADQSEQRGYSAGARHSSAQSRSRAIRAACLAGRKRPA
jgi:type II secretory pathway pseudopilin PulG